MARFSIHNLCTQSMFKNKILENITKMNRNTFRLTFFTTLLMLLAFALPALAQGSVNIVAESVDGNSVNVGDEFVVNINIEAGSQQVDGGEIHLTFDDSLVSVVSTSTTGSPLAVPIINAVFNNDNGTIDYAAGTFSNFPSGDFLLLSVTFSADAAGEFSLEAILEGFPVTNVTRSGNSVFSGNFISPTVTLVENIPPVAVNDSASTNEDNSVNIDVLDNDTDADEDVLSVISVSDPANGSTTIENDGTITFTPDANFNGEATFTYEVSDGEASDEGAVTVTVTAVNDAPVANDDTATVAEDGSINIDVLGNDNDAEEDELSVIKVSDPANGSVTLENDGTFTYEPDANFTGEDSFTYKVNDGEFDSADATVTITVTPVNDAPVANDDSASTDEGEAVTIAVLDNDNDIDSNTLSVIKVADPANGSVELNQDGSFTYTPAANFTGEDSFTYKVNDTQADSNTATVTIVIGSVNDAPVANDDSFSTNEEQAVNGNVLDNDTDEEDDDLTATKISDPANGDVTLNEDGSFTYTPDQNFNGEDSFTYQANDGSLNSNIATVTITVNGTNDAPVANNDNVSTNQGAQVVIPVLANDIDIDDDNLTVIKVTNPFDGGVTLNQDGSFTYTPNDGFAGTDSFTYRVNDGQVDSNIAIVSITVSPVTDAFIVVTPSVTDVFVNQTFDVVIQVQGNGQQMDAAEFHLDFDPSILQVSELIAGNTLQTPLQNQFNNSLGTVDYAAGTFSNFPSGTFTLATLRFQAIAEGTSSLDFTDTFPRQTIITFAGQNVLSGTTGGSVNVSAAAELIGSFTMQGRSDYDVELSVKLYEPGQTTPSYEFNPTATSEGEFTISGIEPGTYEIAIKYDNTLQNVRTVTLTTGDNTASFGQLRAGDANGDNLVSSVDFSIIVTTFNLTSGTNGYDARADFNGDGVVNSLDFSLLVTNFNTPGEEISGQ